MRLKTLLAVGIAGAIALGSVGTAHAADWRLSFSVGRVMHGGHYYYWNGHNYDPTPGAYYRAHYHHRHHRHRHHH